MRRFLARSIMALMALPLAALLLGFAGAIHPAGDSLAVFRQPLAAIVAVFSVLLILTGTRWRGALGLGIAVLAFVTTLPHATPGPSGGEVIRVYQKNLLSLLTGPKPLIEDIRNSNADIVTLEEVADRNKPVVEALSDLYPYQTSCDSLPVGGQVVLSKFPSVGPTLPCDPSQRLAGMLVDTGRHRVWVVALHMRWPWPYDQAVQAASVAKVLQTLEEPVILGGDFNMVPWGDSVHRVARAGSMQLAGQAGATFRLPDLRFWIPIDHVLMPEGSRAALSETRPRFKSDHRGVLARFELP